MRDEIQKLINETLEEGDWGTTDKILALFQKLVESRRVDYGVEECRKDAYKDGKQEGNNKLVDDLLSEMR